MRVKGRAAACVLACVLAGLLCGSSRSGAQTITLAISALAADSTSPAPVMTITARDNRPDLGPYTVSLELSLESQFRSPFYINVAADEFAQFTVDSLLPERTMIFFRARLSDRFGTVVAQTPPTQHPVRSWLRLVAPAAGNPANLSTRSPRFVWSSPPITVPPGLWVWDLAVINKRTGQPDFSREGLNDTSFVFPQLLESNTAYRWQVHARAQGGRPGDQVSVMQEGSFVIASTDQPTFTLLYQNFPNPFGRGERSAVTCFWLDLAHHAKVKLTIYDIRLREVRNVIPSPQISGMLDSGAYGRQNVGTSTGCAKGLEWDGRDDAGRFVPPGVYVAVFEGDGTRQSIKIVFKGQ
ncbi:MAG: hypothetical protein ABJF01_16000 [bacterium]